MARAGEILLDDATLRAARGRLATDPRGAVVLRGQSTAVQLHALRGEAGVGPWIPFRAANPGPLVGRTAELEAIRAVLERVQRTGRGAALLIEGDAGVGKTRLLQAVEALARDRDFAWSWTENVSYAQNEPYRWARLFAQVDRRRARRRLGDDGSATPVHGCISTNRGDAVSVGRSRPSPATLRSPAGRRRRPTPRMTRPR